MKYSLVGNTGFVGGNLAASHPFDNSYNAGNIHEAFGTENGLVVYSGLPQDRLLADEEAGAGEAWVRNALENMRRMRPERLVLISTVEVYPRVAGVYEDTEIDAAATGGYGRNCLLLETLVRQEFSDALIVRLPSPFGENMTENFVYDMLTLIPAALTEQQYAGLCKRYPPIQSSYAPGGDGLYRLTSLTAEERASLRRFFEKDPRLALCGTDSRSVYQFYGLAGLWADIRRCLKAGLLLVNLATQPVQAGALYGMLFGGEFENYLPGGPVQVDVRTRHGRALGGNDEYVADRSEVVAGVAKFVGRHWEG